MRFHFIEMRKVLSVLGSCIEKREKALGVSLLKLGRTSWRLCSVLFPVIFSLHALAATCLCCIIPIICTYHQNPSQTISWRDIFLLKKKSLWTMTCRMWERKKVFAPWTEGYHHHNFLFFITTPYSYPSPLTTHHYNIIHNTWMDIIL